MKKLFIASLLMVFVQFTYAQITPEIYSWVRNTTGATGYNGIPSNVQVVQYSATDVYVSCTCIPGYSIGPWGGNPNIPSNQNFVFKITRSPQQNSGTPTTIGLGHIGVWTNGVSVFNVSDAQSYMNQGIWNRNAYFWEGPGFDLCLGHPQQQGEYHHHVSPTCLYNDADSLNHSPIIGYAFDGFPIYGGRDINGSVIAVSQLDACNGITSPTPEFPGGVYHYVLPEGVTNFQSSLRCYSGTVSNAQVASLQSGGICQAPSTALAALKLLPGVVNSNRRLVRLTAASTPKPVTG